MYVKIFSRILDSSIWDEDNETRLLWITLLAKADWDGFVIATDHAIALAARLSDAATAKSLAVLQAPDPQSTSPACEGKRIEKVQGGYLIVNYSAYRELVRRDHVREQTRLRVARHRERQLEQAADGVDGVTQRNVEQRSVTIRHGSVVGSSPPPPPPDQEREIGSSEMKPPPHAGASTSIEQTHGPRKEKPASRATAAAFAKIWARYPCKSGKKAAERHYRASIQTTDDMEFAEQALDHYLASDRVQRGFIQNGSTWFNNWRDWLEPTEAMMRDLRNNGKTEQQQEHEQRRRLEGLKRVRENCETT